MIARNPIEYPVAAVSCGVVDGELVLDLDYVEDSAAEADANFVMTERGEVVEVQLTGEARPLTKDQTHAMFTLAEKGIHEIIAIQRQVLRMPELYFG